MDENNAVFVAPATQVNLDFGGTLKFSGDVSAMARINDLALSEELKEQPATLAWLGVLAASANKAAAAAEDNLRTVTADVYQALREEAEKANIKTTEEKLKQAVAGSERVISARDKVTRTAYDSEITKNLLTSFKERGDLLVALANDRRSELKNLNG